MSGKRWTAQEWAAWRVEHKEAKKRKKEAAQATDPSSTRPSGEPSAPSRPSPGRRPSELDLETDRYDRSKAFRLVSRSSDEREKQRTRAEHLGMTLDELLVRSGVQQSRAENLGMAVEEARVGNGRLRAELQSRVHQLESFQKAYIASQEEVRRSHDAEVALLKQEQEAKLQALKDEHQTQLDAVKLSALSQAETVSRPVSAIASYSPVLHVLLMLLVADCSGVCLWFF